MTVKDYLKRYIMIIMIIIVTGIAVVIIIVSAGRKEPGDILPTAGVDYIRTMEGVRAADIENKMHEADRQKMIETAEEEIYEDPDLVWSYFGNINAVVMGDSRVLGFSAFGYMDENRVLAEGGATIADIPSYYDLLQMINPQLLVLSYGINDINADWVPWSDLDGYVEYLNGVMADLTELLPYTYIYVQSIIPVNEIGLETSPSWGQIPWWNEVIMEDCREMGWRYIDITDLVYDYWWCLEVDGVHMQTFFYTPWAQAILVRYVNDNIENMEGYF